jgi:hypothetical protein
MQAVPPSSFLLRSIVLATLGLFPLGLMAASAQTSRNRPPAPADANRPASPPASLDMLKERDEELEKLRAEQRRIDNHDWYRIKTAAASGQSGRQPAGFVFWPAPGGHDR